MAPSKFNRETSAAARRGNRGAAKARDERALLAEFARCDSVASLADAIAARLGGKVRKADLIAQADLDPRRGKG